MKFFNSPVHLCHLQDLADVYANETELKGNPEVNRPSTPTYNDVPCFADRMSSNYLSTILGMTDSNRYKLIFPLQHSTVDLTIKKGYIVQLTKYGHTTVEKLTVESVMKYPCSHIEVEAVRSDV